MMGLGESGDVFGIDVASGSLVVAGLPLARCAAIAISISAGSATSRAVERDRPVVAASAQWLLNARSAQS